MDVNGKKDDKCYTDPSKKFKLYYKADALRHISKEMKNKGSGKFKVEKVIAEGLPPGWTKEIRVKKKGGKTRKDPYYIDPESGQVFRSLKEVFRYLGTKDCSKAEPELKDQGPNNVEAGGSLSSLPSEAEEQKVGESKAADGQIAMNERLKLGEEHVIKPNGTECCTSPPGKTTHLRKKGGVIENNYVAQVNNLESNKDSNPIECQLVSAHVARERGHEEVVPPAGKEVVEKHGHKIIHKKRKKLRNNKMASLPCRTSKRLAGIEADASLELKTYNQGSQAGATKQQKGQTKAVVTNNNLNEGIERPKTGNAANEKKQEDDATLPLKKLHSPDPDGNDREVGPNSKDGEKTEITPESSSSSSCVKDMWMDPCIDFAIKTLTGAIPIGDEKKVDETPQSSLSCSSAGNPQSSVELPFGGDIWADPCFAFAVKTLTGKEIPITDDLSAQKVLEQQCSATGPQITNGLPQPPSIRLDDFRQVNNLSAPRHFNMPEKPFYKPQGPVAPPPPPSAYQNNWLAKFGSNQPSSLC
ncbi:PREDICTED: methyl-CpG-binding domain-containing protein 13 isoform X1 [Ipomoea nil]|uniref:methyl-CpG-binding domain-containing protein 13 isoform X1 n=2 Tax=Ipomoea nil TaxID=35883 RepID=UPI0009011796|nr:PREDICTED: methyl-CpG-binding domain-containing protein 13 isoform X1 [Ipomoea nil]